ncbi:MAG: acetyl esterase [Gammaproteobacteria bacterium]|jgi:acetyl esterase
MALTEQDLEYARPDGGSLLARVYQDRELDPRDAVVSIHGGAWNKNDRTTTNVIDRALANAGLTVVALDFRQGPTHRHPAASQDICAGVRYVRRHAERLGIAADRIGIVGSSSGGQLALLAGLQPDLDEHRGTPIIGLNGEEESGNDISSALAYVAALWPVSDPLARYRYAQETGREELVQNHNNYFSSEDEMHAASIPRILDAGEARAFPPIWVAQPGADANVPQEMTFDLLRAAQARDVQVNYNFYPSQAHAFTYDDTPQARQCINDVIRFIKRRLHELTA